MGESEQTFSPYLYLAYGYRSIYFCILDIGSQQLDATPVGTTFNPDTVRSEMASVDAFWEVITNPVAVSKFIHSVSSGWVTGGVFVVGVSCYYLMRKRNVEFARKSAFVGAAVAMAGTMAV
ncbi:MAG: cytochrome ubiquinol oxidase subunit I, partial [Flavobacteriales bacterium]|nr:cytochrome ubiquinol oxidase subunit I [Flavobacteriales bacterium]